jgi:hypothetical protein
MESDEGLDFRSRCWVIILLALLDTERFQQFPDWGDVSLS